MDLTTEQMRALFDRIFRQMALAGWVDHFTYTEGFGWRVAWTDAGAEHAVCLKKISETFRLADDDRAPMAFTVVCQGGRFPGFVVEPPEELSSYWNARLAELHIVQDADELLALVHIVKGWAPDVAD